MAAELTHVIVCRCVIWTWFWCCKAVIAMLGGRKGTKEPQRMANATFFSFFDLGVGVGAMAFGQLAHLFGYGIIYIVAAGSVMTAFIYYIFLVATGRRKTKQINEM